MKELKTFQDCVDGWGAAARVAVGVTEQDETPCCVWGDFLDKNLPTFGAADKWLFAEWIMAPRCTTLSQDAIHTKSPLDFYGALYLINEIGLIVTTPRDYAFRLHSTLRRVVVSRATPDDPNAFVFLDHDFSPSLCAYLPWTLIVEWVGIMPAVTLLSQSDTTLIYGTEIQE